MRICFASLFYTDTGLEAGAPLMRALPEALSGRGHDVAVVHLSARDATVQTNGVTHHFVRPPAALHHAAGLASGLSGRPRPYFEWPRGLPSLLRSIRPDIVHLHGTQQHIPFARLRRALPPRARLVVHYHGGAPSQRLGWRPLQRRNLCRADAVLFTTPDQSETFAAAGMRARSTRSTLLVETSSDFGWMDRRTARAKTGMYGRPVYLSAARLHPIKDPLTVLHGFAEIANDQSDARLYLYYLSDELLPAMRAFVAERTTLRDVVHFRGRTDRSEMEAVFNSADFLLQASRREFSGCAVLDAAACGVVPIVTDLPSFRAIAGDCGKYFPVGDARTLARCAMAIRPDDLAARSDALRTRFQQELSFSAMAAKLEGIYESILDTSSMGAR